MRLSLNQSRLLNPRDSIESHLTVAYGGLWRSNRGLVRRELWVEENIEGEERQRAEEKEMRPN